MRRRALGAMMSFDDRAYGRVTMEPRGDAIHILFECFEADDDLIIPQHRVVFTMEHVATWVERLLVRRFGRRCKRLNANDLTEKRRRLMLKLTAADAGLAYCTHAEGCVVLIRNGCVYKVRLGRLEDPMGVFYASIREEDPGSEMTVAKALADYVHGCGTGLQ